jgi:hypothetical protein
MEDRPMRTSIALDTSPTTILRSLRGQIVGARIAYPEVLHIEVCDDAGGLWRFATQDAEFAPADPGALIGRTLEEAGIDPITTELRFRSPMARSWWSRQAPSRWPTTLPTGN